MTKKTSKPYRMAPLQKLKVRPIKDPAEQAALDEKLKRNEKATAAERAGECFSGKETPLAVVKLCRQLSAEGRLFVVNELMDQMSLSQRMKLLELLITELPPEALYRFEESRRGHAGVVGTRGNSEDGPKQE
jgi:hypothetical protein